MIDTSTCQEYFESVKNFADEINLTNNFNEMINYLNTYADHENKGLTRCRLFKDFAPYSFSFTMDRKDKNTGEYVYWFNGGLIFHGKHDNGGDGSSPTYSVCLSPTNGWTIHT